MGDEVEDKSMVAHGKAFDANYEVRLDMMSWGHGMFGAHEVGGTLRTHALFKKNYLPLQGNQTNHTIPNKTKGKKIGIF